MRLPAVMLASIVVALIFGACCGTDGDPLWEASGWGASCDVRKPTCDKPIGDSNASYVGVCIALDTPTIGTCMPACADGTCDGVGRAGCPVRTGSGCYCAACAACE